MKIVVAQRVAAALACVGMLVQPALAATPVAAAPVVADVALAQGGVFSGKVVTAQGAPIAKTAVSLQQAGVVVATAETNAEGIFAVQGLRGGMYQVVADNGVVSYRLWAPNTAPPMANQSALIVTGQEILNGQYCGPACPPNSCPPGGGNGGGVMGWVRQHPLLVAAGIATAIAVPLAVADDDDDPAS